MNKQDKKFILAVVIMQKGFLLLESLLAIFIISVVAVSSLSVTNTFLASAKVSNNLLAENDLRLFIHKSLEGDQCFQNLDSSLLSDSTTEANTKIVELLKVGSIELRTDDPNNEFKNSFIIKKMVLEDDPTEPDQKKMKVYFERKGLKHLSTRDNKACDLNNIEGCYSYTCDVIYTSTPDACSAIDCFAPD